MGLYVVETDAPCKFCGDVHGYVTNLCTLGVWIDYATARWVSSAISGSIVREIREVPDGISFTLYMHKDGRPNGAVPRTISAVSSG